MSSCPPQILPFRRSCAAGRGRDQDPLKVGTSLEQVQVLITPSASVASISPYSTLCPPCSSRLLLPPPIFRRDRTQTQRIVDSPRK
eukprot:5280622-Pyramimonas_sp.AAC.1